LNTPSFSKTIGRYLFDKVKQSKDTNTKGSSLELFSTYLFFTEPNFLVISNIKTIDSQIDLLLRNLNVSDPIFLEFGTYILVECKNWEEKVGTPTIKKFIGDLRYASSKCGILLTKEGVTDKGNQVDEEGNALYTIRKEYHKDGIVIMYFTENDIENIIEGKTNLFSILIRKYEEIRFDKKIAK
jgi:hypothetical protein